MKLKILLFILIFPIAFLMAEKCSADIDLDYSIYEYSYGAYSHLDKGVQQFFPNQPSMSGFNYWAGNGVSEASCLSSYVANDCPVGIFTLCKGIFDGTSYNCEATEFIASTTHRYNCGLNEVNFNINIPVDQGSPYYIAISGHNGACSAEAIVLTLNQDQLGWRYYNLDDGGYKNTTRFQTVFNSGYSNLSFTPYTVAGGMDNLGVYKDFEFWQLDGFTSATTTGLTLEVHYNKVGTLDWYNDFQSFNPFAGSPYPVRISVPKNQKLDNGKYQAIADILVDSSQPYFLATTSIEFWINNLTGSSTWPDFKTYDETCGNICNGIATVTPSAWWDISSKVDEWRYAGECGARKIGCWAFYPSDEKRTMLNNSLNELGNKFPMSVFNQVKAVFDQETSSSSASSTLFSFSLHPLFPNEPAMNVDLINSNSLRTGWGVVTNGVSLFDYIMHWISILLYGMIFVYFILRILSITKKTDQEKV